MRTSVGEFSKWFTVCALPWLLGCGGSTQEPVSATSESSWFVEATSDVKLDFLHDAGPAESYFMPASMGSGAALIDFDQDGRLDIYLLQAGGANSSSTNRLYHQQDDGSFRDVSAGSGLDVAGFGAGVAVGDVDNDGLPDICVTEFGALRLFVNEGNGKFRDVSRAAGLESLLWGTSASFLDFDRDGWLDIVIANYVKYDAGHPCYGRLGKRDFCSPTEFAGSVALLYRNRTPENANREPRFDDVTEPSGLEAAPGPGLGVLCADFDHDGWDDIYIANDQQPNRLWINQKNGTFRDEAVLRGLATDGLGKAEASMGLCWGDIEGDGLADLFSTNLDLETHTLWKQSPAGLFMDRTSEAQLTRIPRTTGFGTVFGDFDLDGDLDLAYVNGKVFAGEPVRNDNIPPFWRSYAEPNMLFENDGAGRFQVVNSHNPAFCGRPEVTRALCCGDLDNDGDLDLLAATTAGPARVFRNVAARKGHWLLIRAIDPALNRDSYGAVITVIAAKRTFQRLINPGYSYESSNDHRAHFGLGSAAQFDSIEVRWPDGTTEKFKGGSADQLLILRKGEGAAE
jgi:hypothetical protein